MRTLLTLALLAATLPSLPAASITLISQSGGTFNYGLTVDSGEVITFFRNRTIELTGLSGVTGAAGLGSLFNYTAVSTPSTVTFTQTAFSADTFGGPNTFNSSGQLVGDDDRAGGLRTQHRHRRDHRPSAGSCREHHG